MQPLQRYVLAPMAGVTDITFRRICRALGCQSATTEMVSAKGLCYGAAATRALLHHEGGQLIAQLFGSDPAVMADAAAIIADYAEQNPLPPLALPSSLQPLAAPTGSDDQPRRFSCIDINMGCPVHKVVSQGEGSALMRTPGLAASLVRTACRQNKLPVTVKLRLGWDESSINYLQVAEACVQAGAAGVALHARTRSQGYAGRADWQAIAALKQHLGPIPVWASGDIFTPRDALAVQQQTGCDGVLIARGILGAPWFFAGLPDGRMPAVSARQRADIALLHAAELQAAYGPRALVAMRKHIAWYVRGTPGAVDIRRAVNSITDYAQLQALLESWVACAE